MISNDDDDDDDDNDDQLCETAARAPLEPAHVHGNFYVLISSVEWHRLVVIKHFPHALVVTSLLQFII